MHNMLACPAYYTQLLLTLSIKQRLIDEMEKEEDSLRFYFLGKNWRRRVEHVGAKPSYDPEGPLIT